MGKVVPEKKEVSYTIRMPPALLERAQAVAKATKQSINATFVYVIEWGLNAEEGLDEQPEKKGSKR